MLGSRSTSTSTRRRSTGTSRRVRGRTLLAVLVSVVLAGSAVALAASVWQNSAPQRAREKGPRPASTPSASASASGRPASPPAVASAAGGEGEGAPGRLLGEVTWAGPPPTTSAATTSTSAPLPPVTFTIHLLGLPRSGTTWAAVLVTEALRILCVELLGIPRCTHTGAVFHVQHHFSADGFARVSEDGSMRRDVIVRFTDASKHWLVPHEGEGNVGTWIRCLTKLPPPASGKPLNVSACVPPTWAPPSGPLVRSETGVVKYLLVLRNPRDSQASHCNLADSVRLANTTEPIDDCMVKHIRQRALETAVRYEWHARRLGAEYGTHAIYEKMRVDPAGLLDAIGRLVGIRFPASVVAQAVAWASSENQILQANLTGFGKPTVSKGRIVAPSGVGRESNRPSAKVWRHCADVMREILPMELQEQWLDHGDAAS